VAIYMPAARRRRRAALALGAALVGGLVVGVFVGRFTAPSVDGRVATVRSEARTVQGELQATPINYEKELQGETQFVEGGGVADALARARRQLDGALADTPWLGRESRASARAALAALSDARQSRVPPEEFSRLVTQASDQIGQVFGLR
jgi:uncharacterized membrane-anchored protein YhcB (DUF1043 family)